MTRTSVLSSQALGATPSTLKEARRLCQEGQAKIQDLAACLYQDPVMALAVLRHANSVERATSRHQNFRLTALIPQLGWGAIAEVLRSLDNVEPIRSQRKQRWIEVHRSRCRRTGMVARIIGQEVAADLTELCHLAGLLLHLGEMIAVTHFGTIYLELAENNPRNRVNYRLSTDYGFDPEKAGLEYLRSQGVPSAVTEALDRDGVQRDPSLVRPIIFASSELVEAFDSGKTAKYDRFEDLPSSSQLRLFKITDRQYTRLYRRISQYLESDQIIQSNLTKEIPDEFEIQDQASAEVTDPPSQKIPSAEAAALSAQPTRPLPAEKVLPTIENPSNVALSEETVARLAKLRKLVDQSAATSEPPINADTATGSSITPVAEQDKALASPLDGHDEQLALDLERFHLKNTAESRHYAQAKRVLQHKPFEDESSQRISSDKELRLRRIMEATQDSEQLLAVLLTLLIQNGFEKSAIIVAADDKIEGLVISCRGIGLRPGHRIKLHANTSTISTGLSKIQSAPGGIDPHGIMGSSTYATALLKADHPTNISVYADAGTDQIISFEARRNFRCLIKIANELLPSLSGGLLIEIPGIK